MATTVWTLLAVLLLADNSCALLGDSFTLKSFLNYGMQSMGVLDTLNQVHQTIEATRQEIYDTVSSARQQASEAISSRYNFILDLVDDHALMGAFAELIPEAREKGYGNNTCIEGIKVKKTGTGTLILSEGILRYRKSMDLIALQQEDRGTEQLYNSSFTFSDIYMHFSWSFTSDSFPYMGRVGTLDLIMKGPNRVTVSATTPRSRHVFDDLLNNNKCFLTVESVEVVLGADLEVDQVDYYSLTRVFVRTKQGVTEWSVRAMIADMTGEIMAQLRKTLLFVVAPLTTKRNVFCETTLTDVPPIMCDKIKWLGEYW